jgi:hypothetical protein
MKKCKQQFDKEQYKRLLDDICSDYCEPGKYCILKEFLISSHPSPRILMQMKCLEKWKFINKIDNWTDAMNKWVEDGLAEKFGNVYDEDLKFSELYKQIMEK